MNTTLTVQGVTKRFGGLTALNQVSLTLSAGQVHGLIGPNGSGKTTLMNMISGYYQPDAGRIACGDQVISGMAVQARPALGISRTFQKPRLLGSLSVLDNVLLGHWTSCRAGFLESMFRFARVRREDRASRTRATELLEGVGLAHAAHRLAGLLEHAEQRFLEIARGLMTRPRFLMLDEPAGGLTHGEIGHLRAVVETVRDSGIGVLLVEHHTDFVFRVSDQVTTLDLGRVIAHGTPAAVQSNPDVIRVYLGT